MHYVKTFNEGEEFDSLEGIIPSATLLTGVNQPDHVNQFLALINKIRYVLIYNFHIVLLLH